MNNIENSKVSQFKDLIFEGIEKWVKAGEILVDLLDSDKLTYEQICTECDGITPDIIARFEQIGRKQLHPRLLVNTSSGYKRLMQMPYSIQEKYSKEPIPVLVESSTGADQILIKAEDLSPHQCSQVFKRGGIRDLGAQRAYIKEQDRIAKEAREAEVECEHVSPWFVKGNKVIIRQTCQMDKGELLKILAEIR